MNYSLTEYIERRKNEFDSALNHIYANCRRCILYTPKMKEEKKMNAAVCMHEARVCLDYVYLCLVFIFSSSLACSSSHAWNQIYDSTNEPNRRD